MEHQTATTENFKTVTLGDKGCGKTRLVTRYATDYYMEEEYDPCVRDSLCKKATYGSKVLEIQLLDPSGDDMFDRIRRLTYPDTQVFVVCFSLVDRASFERVSSKWVPDIRGERPEAPWVLVGNKLDLRTDSTVLKQLDERKETPISTKEGEKLAKKLGAFAYIENSAKTNENVTQVFEMAMKAAHSHAKPDDKCVIM